MNIDLLVSEEVKVINSFFAKRNIFAKVTNAENIPFASFVYTLSIAPSVTISTIEGIERELCNTLYNFRRNRHNIDKGVTIRIRDMPLALEISHPSPSILIPSDKHLAQPGLMGKSCVTRNKVEFLNLAENGQQHTLIAALSGGGKSSLMKSILSTMLLHTSFDVVKVVLIDLKNTDLYPFRNLPHTLAYASTVEEAINTIAWVKAECEARKQSQEIDYRLFLVFDELAELTKIKSKVVTQAMLNLSSIMSVGRSLDVCTLCATQYPNKQTLDIVNTGFQQRFIGKMDSIVSANVACKRAGSGAENLVNPGDFVKVTNTIERFKAFLFDDNLTNDMVNRIETKWRKHTAKKFADTSTVVSSTNLTHPLFAQNSQKSVSENSRSVLLIPSTTAVVSTERNSRTVEATVEASQLVEGIGQLVEEKVEVFGQLVEEFPPKVEVKVEEIDPEIVMIATKIADEWRKGGSKNRLTLLALGRNYGGSYKLKMDKVFDYLAVKYGKD